MSQLLTNILEGDARGKSGLQHGSELLAKELLCILGEVVVAAAVKQAHLCAGKRSRPFGGARTHDFIPGRKEKMDRAIRGRFLPVSPMDQPQQPEVGPEADNVFGGAFHRDAVGLPGRLNEGIIREAPGLDGKHIVAEIPQRGADGEGAAEQQHPGEGDVRFFGGQKAQQAAHGMAHIQHPVAAKAKFPGLRLHAGKPVCHTCAAELFGGGAVTGKINVHAANIRG